MIARFGDLDPGLGMYLAQTESMSETAFNEMVNYRTGLLGFSKISSDLRDKLLDHKAYIEKQVKTCRRFTIGDGRVQPNDHCSTAKAVARKLGLDRVDADVLPNRKGAWAVLPEVWLGVAPHSGWFRLYAALSITGWCVCGQSVDFGSNFYTLAYPHAWRLNHE